MITGVGSLVNKDILEGSEVVGVPCRVVDKFEDYRSNVYQ